MLNFFKSLFGKNITNEKIVQPTEETVMSNNAVNAIDNNRVGPVMRSGDVAQAAIEAAKMDNPDKDISIEDKVAYIRISTDHELILTQESMEECLGRQFKMNEIEINLASFAGQIDVDSKRVRFYFNLTV